jgi:hypothetical protein
MIVLFFLGQRHFAQGIATIGNKAEQPGRRLRR